MTPEQNEEYGSLVRGLQKMEIGRGAHFHSWSRHFDLFQKMTQGDLDAKDYAKLIVAEYYLQGPQVGFLVTDFVAHHYGYLVDFIKNVDGEYTYAGFVSRLTELFGPRVRQLNELLSPAGCEMRRMPYWRARVDDKICSAGPYYWNGKDEVLLMVRPQSSDLSNINGDPRRLEKPIKLEDVQSLEAISYYCEVDGQWWVVYGIGKDAVLVDDGKGYRIINVKDDDLRLVTSMYDVYTRSQLRDSFGNAFRS